MGIWMSTAAEENYHAGPALNEYQQQQQQGQQQQGQQHATTEAGASTTSSGGQQHHSHHHSHHHSSTAMLTRRPSRDRSGAGGAGRKGESTRAADWAWENSHWTKLRANKERDRDVPKCRCVLFFFCVLLFVCFVGRVLNGPRADRWRGWTGH